MSGPPTLPAALVSAPQTLPPELKSGVPGTRSRALAQRLAASPPALSERSAATLREELDRALAVRALRDVDLGRPKAVTKVVLMGMGEPLLNFDAVTEAI